MGKPSVNNAFTLLEGLFVLLIISLLTLVTIFKPVSSSLKLFGNQILSYCVFTQEKAFMDKEQKNVEIKTDHAIFDKIRFNFPIPSHAILLHIITTQKEISHKRIRFIVKMNKIQFLWFFN